jgi:hypothetical protein
MHDKKLVADLEDRQLALEIDFQSDSDEYKLLDRIIAELKRREWRPISEAPKDGTYVDLWINIYASPRSMGMSDSFVVRDAWHEEGKWFHYDIGQKKEIYSNYVTHFMLRPEPPTETANE